MLKLLPVVAAAALLASGCGGGQAPAEGDALEVGAASTYAVAGPGALPPGVEVSLMLTALRNGSDRALVVDGIEPLGVEANGDGAAAGEVAGVELAVRGEEIAEAVPLGFYAGPRPAVEVDGACIVQPTESPDGFALEPAARAGEDVFVVLRVRTAAEGTFSLDGLRVVYELDGRPYFQDIRDELVVEVVAGADPDVPDDQAPCLADA